MPLDFRELLFHFHPHNGVDKGINVKLVSKNWYNSDNLIPGTLFFFGESVEVSEPVFFEGEKCLVPIMPLFECLEIELDWIDDNTAVASYGERNMKLIFEETEHSYYNTVRLVDIDTGINFTLGYNEIGLYTYINNSIYVSHSTAKQICVYLGYSMSCNTEQKTVNISESVIKHQTENS